ncbi:MAG: disulfide bond formation protein B [Minisyncoccia bacterium]
MVNSILNVISFLVFISQIVIVVILFAQKLYWHKINNLLNKYHLLFSILVSFFALSGSLFFSYILKFQACDLCIIQRILMILIFILLLFFSLMPKKIIYLLLCLLIVLGILLSLYQYILQIFHIDSSNFCNISSLNNNSCTKIDFIKFGYITIPYMSFVGFLLIGILLIKYN